VTAVGSRSKATVMMIPYTPTGMSNVGDQIMQALLAKEEMMLGEADGSGTPPVARPPEQA
jgi:hypothetical protein